MILLDLFCKAGGAAKGYVDAGFRVVGVDIEPQPNYPFEFIQADAFDVTRWPRDFHAVHASPPCHDHSTVTGPSRKIKGEHGTGWMLAATRELFDHLTCPWVIENVQGAKMPEAPCTFRLCGSSFGLDLRRHRKFISNVQMAAPACDHAWQTPRFRSLRTNMRHEGRLSPVVGVHGNTNYAGEFEIRCKAMEIDWMTNAELVQSLPPRYTEWIGARLMEHLDGTRR